MRSVVVLALAALWVPSAATALPAGFVETDIGGNFSSVAGLEWDSAGRMFVVERSGVVWIVENGVRLPTPFLDLSDEVGGWRDYGLLGFRLHPNFDQNGYVYLLYIVDHHHLAHAGTPQYDPGVNEYFQATIGRITRYTADPATGFSTILPESRLVLLGETAGTGFPIMHQSHGTGSIVFGEDGTLLATCGDGASYSSTDTGSANETYYQQAIDEGIIPAAHNIGAMRVQLLSSLAGKMVRLDPLTGDGLPSNPWYDAGDPRAPRSRTWVLGLRNPYRFTRKAGTGSHDPAAGDPGVFFLGDVGWGGAEDLHVFERGGANAGWPLYEGLRIHGGYWNRNVAHPDMPNPLFGVNGCAIEYLRINDLLVDHSHAVHCDDDADCGQGSCRDDHCYSWPNPCDPTVEIPDSWTDGNGDTHTYEKHVHTRPPIDWRGGARIATYDAGGNPTDVPITDATSPVTGPAFGGNASTGGSWYHGAGFPTEWQDTYFHADYGRGWIKAFDFDVDHHLLSVRDFLPDGNRVVYVGWHPTADGLYYVKWGDRVRRIAYAPGGDLPPVAQAESDVSYGPGPLTVQFTGSGSTDPEALPLQYRWDFGDGNTSNLADPQHIFVPANGDPTEYLVRLTVTDAGLQVADAELTISANNTPPIATIGSPAAGSTYPLGPDIVVDLDADVDDAEHDPASLDCRWDSALHHNDHTHDNPPVFGCSGVQAVLSPVGCDGNTYFYRYTLTVTDGAGLETTEVVDVHPECGDPCIDDADCDDGDPCTEDLCGPFQLCEHPDRAPGPGNAVIPYEVGTAVVGSAGWTPVMLTRTYTDPVVVATPPAVAGAAPLVTRVRNTGPAQFELKLQFAATGAADVADVPVEYVVVEAGAYDAATHGIDLEAGTRTSVVTDHSSSWVGEALPLAGGFSAPVVVGQVMTANDPAWSTFWARGTSRSNPPSAGNVWVGKQVAEDPDRVRADETLGYIVTEAGGGSLCGRSFVAGLSGDTVRGVGNAPPYTVSTTSLPGVDAAVLSAAAIDGVNGGWPLFYGADGQSFDVAIEEDTLRDAERSHTTEQVAYLLFSPAVAGPAVVDTFTADASPVFAGTPVTLQWTTSDATSVDIAPGAGSGLAPDGSVVVAPLATTTYTLTAYGPLGDTTAEVTVTVEAPPAIPFAYGVAPAATDDWLAIDTGVAFTEMVVVATPAYDVSAPPLVARVRPSAAANSFELRVQRTDGAPDASPPVPVHWIAVEAGVYNAASHGITLEAGFHTPGRVDRKGSWVAETLALAQAYTAPVVLGQVASDDDARWSVFWARGGNQKDPPTAGDVRIGQHVAEDPDIARTNDRLAYIVVEAGNWTLGGRAVAAGLGANTVAGVTNAPPYAYPVGGLPSVSFAVVSAAGMNGGNGGWPILYGPAPVGPSLQLAYEEDQLADAERSHITEQVAFFAIE